MNKIFTPKEWLEKYPLWIAALFALVGTYGLITHLTQYKHSLGIGMGLKNILVSKRALPAGTVLSENDMYLQAIPEKYTPIAALFESDLSKAVGKKTTRPISPDEMIQWASINPSTVSAGYLSSTIPQGYRAISVQVSNETSLGNQIQKGDRVDILIQASKKSGASQATVTLLQNLHVVDVGEASSEDKLRSYSILSLLVLPHEASLISHAKQFGSLQFILRNPEDQEYDSNSRVLDQSLFTKNAFHGANQHGLMRKIEMIRGGKKEVY